MIRCASSIALLLFCLNVLTVNGDEQTSQSCAELLNGEPTSDAEKRAAELCKLFQVSDVIGELSDTLQEKLGALLSEQGLKLDESPEAVEKRKNEYLRFGKRKNEYLRFGKRKNEYLRFGKRKNEYLRFGKRKNEYLRFG